MPEERQLDAVKSENIFYHSVDAQSAASEALWKVHESKYRHLIEHTNSLVLEMDPGGNVIFINPFAQDFFGYPEAEILGRSVIDTIVPHYDSAGNDLKKMIDDIVHHPESYLHNENENICRNGNRVWVVWSNQPVYDQYGDLKEILCIGINRTEQKRAEELLAQQQRERAAAQERTRLARDLHDAVSQTLFSASLIAEVLPALWDRNPQEGRKRLEEIRQLTRGALAEMRTLLLELRPSALLDAELPDLLRQLAESITGRARIPVSLNVAGRCSMAPEVKVALYRIAQESLNNVAKHAGADQARVRLACNSDGIELTISDNGRGFSLKEIRPESLGMGIMRERAKGIGAQLTIKSRPGKGTHIKVVWQKEEIVAQSN